MADAVRQTERARRRVVGGLASIGYGEGEIRTPVTFRLTGFRNRHSERTPTPANPSINESQTSSGNSFIDEQHHHKCVAKTVPFCSKQVPNKTDVVEGAMEGAFLPRISALEGPYPTAPQPFEQCVLKFTPDRGARGDWGSL